MHRALRRGPLQLITTLAIFAVGGAAFTAVNTVPQTSTGEGAAAISGFAVSNIAYVLDPTNPPNMTSGTIERLNICGPRIPHRQHFVSLGHGQLALQSGATPATRAKDHRC
jgi:hypothetical protein